MLGRKTKGKEHMKTILTILTLLLMPIALLSVCFDVAKAALEDLVLKKLAEKEGK